MKRNAIVQPAWVVDGTVILAAAACQPVDSIAALATTQTLPVPALSPKPPAGFPLPGQPGPVTDPMGPTDGPDGKPKESPAAPPKPEGGDDSEPLL